MRDHMKKDLNVRPFRLMFVNKLSDEDRILACHVLLTQFSNAVNHGKVMFSDECAIYHSTHDRNIVFWAKDNPHYKLRVTMKPASRNDIGSNDISTPVWTIFF